MKLSKFEQIFEEQKKKGKSWDFGVMGLFRMKGLKDCKPLMVMVAIDFAFAIVNILLETVLDHGMNHLVLITYRLSIAAISLAPIAYFAEK